MSDSLQNESKISAESIRAVEPFLPVIRRSTAAMKEATRSLELLSSQIKADTTIKKQLELELEEVNKRLENDEAMVTKLTAMNENQLKTENEVIPRWAGELLVRMQAIATELDQFETFLSEVNRTEICRAVKRLSDRATDLPQDELVAAAGQSDAVSKQLAATPEQTADTASTVDGAFTLAQFNAGQGHKLRQRPAMRVRYHFNDADFGLAQSAEELGDEDREDTIASKRRRT